MSNVKIISNGSSQSTQVKVGNEYINGITKIVISPIEVDGLVSATITINAVALDLGLKANKIKIKLDSKQIEESIVKDLLMASESDH